MKRKLINTVKLEMFQDDATGDYGLTHVETNCSDNGFNAFWNGVGIFHDVFEHYHEFTNPLFRGDCALNIVGEMVAMGAAMYYWDYLGVHNRPLTQHHYFTDSARRGTQDLIEEAYYCGYSQYGSRLESCIPYQNPVESGELENMLDTYWNKVKIAPIQATDEDEKERAIEFKKSVKRSVIYNAHRYGYNRAKKLIPDNYENRETLIKFIKLFNEFTRVISAEELYNLYRLFTFNIYRCKGVISWELVLKGNNYDVPNITLTEDSISRYNYIDDFYTMPEEMES